MNPVRFTTLLLTGLVAVALLVGSLADSADAGTSYPPSSQLPTRLPSPAPNERPVAP